MDPIDWTLYHSFSSTDDTPLTPNEKGYLKDKSQRLSAVLKSKVLVLIFQHYIATNGYDNSRLNPTSLPYEMRTKEHNVQFDLEKLPSQLQRILYRFIEVI